MVQREEEEGRVGGEVGGGEVIASLKAAKGQPNCLY